MTIKPFLVDGNLVVNEATITNSGTSIVLPTNSHFSGGGNIFNLASNTTDDITQGTTNLYFTNTKADARADLRISAASITALSDADQTVQTTDNVTFNNITSTGYIAGPASFTIDPAAVGDDTGTVVIAGNLTVNGTTTTVNSNTVNIGDNILVLNSDETGTPSQDAGIEIERGTSTNVSLRFNETTDKWQFTNDGTTYNDLGTSDIVNDTTPQLGGTLDANGNDIDLDGNELILDADGDTKIYANVDDEINLYTQGVGKIYFNYGSNGLQTYEFGGSGAWFSTTPGGIWPKLYLKRNYSSNTPAAGDKLAQIHARGEDSNGLAKTYVSMVFKAESVTQTSDRGSMTLSLHRNNQLVDFYKADASTGVEQNIFYKDIKADTGVNLVFEGATDNTNETTLTVVDPTAGRTITLPDATGTVALTSDIPSLSGYLQNVVEDTTPQLGGNLDLNSKDITGTGNINITGSANFGSNDITTTGKVLFANVYAQLADLPSASTYHGMFAHVHATGAAYYAHAGAWIQLADNSALSNYQTTAGLNGAIDTHLNQQGPTSGYVLAWNGSDYAWVAQSVGAVGGGTDKTFLETDNSVNSNYTLSTNRNAMTTGPVTINSGATITVPSGQRWIIL
tara:strand:- start:127 stop:1998 length:1872 start_codon:yes stop_codon:yes gene_type:complete